MKPSSPWICPTCGLEIRGGVQAYGIHVAGHFVAERRVKDWGASLRRKRKAMAKLRQATRSKE